LIIFTSPHCIIKPFRTSSEGLVYCNDHQCSCSKTYLTTDGAKTVHLDSHVNDLGYLLSVQ